MLNDLLTVAGTTGTTGTTDVITAMIAAFTEGASSMTSMITTIAPIGIGVVVSGLVVTFGVKFFKRISGKA